MFKKIKTFIYFLLLSFLLSPLAFASQANFKLYKNADIKWVKKSQGVEVALLSGNFDKKSFIIARSKMPRDFRYPPVSVDSTSYLTVLSGKLYIGFGKKFDPQKGFVMNPGDFLIIPAGVPHYVWTKKPCTIQFGVTGPLDLHFIKPSELKE